MVTVISHSGTHSNHLSEPGLQTKKNGNKVEKMHILRLMRTLITEVVFIKKNLKLMAKTAYF